jgi:hypothetical protein
MAAPGRVGARLTWALMLAAATLAFPVASPAGVLADDRADVLFHRYEGGGVTIQGPSVLVRKKMAEKYAVSANYYLDMVTSASIDVEVSGASEYKEERTQYSLAAEYLRGKTTYNLSYTDSSENDYDAKTTSFGISQDLFGDLTTISMGFSRGMDTVRNSTDPLFEQDTDRWSYRVGVSQILTKTLITSVNLEVITDEGYLNNPYRSYRYFNPGDNQLFALAQEIYPRTRTSNAVSINGRYFLPYRAAVFGGYRFFTDTWGIRADTFEIGYTQPVRQVWTIEARLRYYRQNNADFYSDIFDRVNQQNFLARDKELSTFNSAALRIGASYEFVPSRWTFIKKGSLNLFYDRIEFTYDDFRDARFSQLPKDNPNFRAAGTEPFYEFGANVIQAFVSIWF